MPYSDAIVTTTWVESGDVLSAGEEAVTRLQGSANGLRANMKRLSTQYATLMRSIAATEEDQIDAKEQAQITIYAISQQVQALIAQMTDLQSMIELSVSPVLETLLVDYDPPEEPEVDPGG